VDVLDAQVDAARADGLGQAVIGVVGVIGEILLPALYQAGRHRLGADVHQPPLVEIVVLKAHVPVLYRVQDVLCPGHQEPDDGDLLLGHGPQDPLRVDASEQHGLAPGQEAPEPVHLRPGMVERGDAQEIIISGLAMVVHLHLARRYQTAVGVKDGLGETGRTGREVYGGIVLIGDVDLGGYRGAAGGERIVVLGEGRAILPYEQAHLHVGYLIAYGVDPVDELGTEDQHIALGQFEAVFDLVLRVAVVEGDGEGASLQYAEVDGQPLQAVHQQYRDLVALFQAPFQQEIGKTVGLVIELSPGHLPPVFSLRVELDELVVLPAPADLCDLGVYLDEADIMAIEGGVVS